MMCVGNGIWMMCVSDAIWVWELQFNLNYVTASVSNLHGAASLFVAAAAGDIGWYCRIGHDLTSTLCLISNPSIYLSAVVEPWNVSSCFLISELWVHDCCEWLPKIATFSLVCRVNLVWRCIWNEIYLPALPTFPAVQGWCRRSGHLRHSRHKAGKSISHL